jgi:ClpP class serine protease
MKWLLTDDALVELRAAMRLQPTAEQLERFEARASRDSSPLTIADSVAQINIEGVLTEAPNWFASLFGGNTAYRDVRAALATADADPNVREIVLNVSSPGGSVQGLFETLAALQGTRKPIRSRASLAASAAFAIVAVAGPIEAITPASAFGSIGVATSIFVDAGVVDIASTEAPNKRPDVTTPAGVAAVRAELDAIHELFAGAIAKGRGTTSSAVNSSYGKGGVLLAKQAMAAGMIDSIASQPRARRSTSTSTSTSAAAPGSQLAAAQAMLAELEQQPSAGPQQKAAARLAAQLGGPEVRGTGESQQQYAARVLAGTQPPAPAPKTLAQRVAEIVIARNRITAPTPRGESAAAMAGGLGKLFSGGLVRPEPPTKKEQST